METNHLLPASWVISDLGSKMKGRKFILQDGDIGHKSI